MMKNCLLLVILFCFGTLCAQQAQAQGMNDNFNDNFLDPARWQKLVPPPTSTVTVTETNQRLEVTMSSGAGGGGIVSVCSVAGDFDVQVDYILLNWPSHNNHSVRLGAYDLGVAGVGEVGMNRNSSGSEVYIFQLLNLHPIASTSDTSGKLRLVRTGSTISGFFFSGTSWVLVGSGAVSTAPTRFNLDLGTNDPSATGGVLIAFDNFQVNAGTISCPCQVPPNVTFHQYGFIASPQESGVPQYFGFSTSDFSNGCKTQSFGCALTATATMLTSFNSLSLGFVPTPSWLNSQLKQQTVGGSCGPPVIQSPGLGYYLGVDDSTQLCTWCDIDWGGIPTATAYKVRLVDSGSQILSTSGCQATSNPVDCYLEQHICANQDRVVLKLEKSANGLPSGEHFVYVEGKSLAPTGTTDWNVFDPGWNPQTTTPSSHLYSLQGHRDGFTTSDGTRLTFKVAEARTFRKSSEAPDRSALSVVVASPVELLVVDPQDLRLGHLEQAGADIFEIPLGSYFRDFQLADDTGTGTGNGDPIGRKTAYIPSPQTGTYSVAATGTALGVYQLNFEAVASDGTVQASTLLGIAAIGLTTDYRVTYSSVPGSPLNVGRLATFQSTLNDITSGLQLGLIDSRGVANSLSQKIQAASDAASRGELQTSQDILNAFKNEVQAQAGKHITGTGVQVLLQDGDSLLSQLLGA